MCIIDTLNICKDFVCAIEYNDLSDISEDEEKLIAEFQHKYAGCIFQWGNSISFTTCDLLRLPADCVECKIVRL